MHSEHSELVVDNVSIVDNHNPIFEEGNECEIGSNWQTKLDDDSVNSTIPEGVEDRNLIFAQDHAHWSIKHEIRRDALDELLNLLNEINSELKVPKHARTVLKTPREKPVIALDGFAGQYRHYGLEKKIGCLFAERRVLPNGEDKHKHRWTAII